MRYIIFSSKAQHKLTYIYFISYIFDLKFFTIVLSLNRYRLAIRCLGAGYRDDRVLSRDLELLKDVLAPFCREQEWCGTVMEQVGRLFQRPHRGFLGKQQGQYS